MANLCPLAEPSTAPSGPAVARRPPLPNQDVMASRGSSTAPSQSSQAGAQQRPFSRSSSVRTAGTSSRPPSAIENHMDYFREPVVKSPPEPTRVKSPEGSVRSPDPINWTVPLDTGKTFSVTQSIKDGGEQLNFLGAVWPAVRFERISQLNHN